MEHQAPFEALPHEVLLMVLKNLPLPQRLGSCSLVQRRWATAAAAATSNIKLRRVSVQQLEQLQAWLQQHGRHLRHLDLEGDYDLLPSNGNLQYPKLAELPCPHLLELRLSHLELWLATRQPVGQLALQGQQPGVLSTCTGLRLLYLDDCWLQQPQDDLAMLAAATSLRSFTLRYPRDRTGSHTNVFPGGLAQLTFLGWASYADNSSSMQQLARLTGLRSLRLLLNLVQPAALEALSQLQQLTSLCFLHMDFSSASMTWLEQLTGLQMLDLHACNDIDTAVLPRLAALQHLVMFSCHVRSGNRPVPAVQARSMPLQHLDMEFIRLDDSEAVRAFMGLLSMCKDLRHLHFHICPRFVSQDPSAYSALTASSQLTYLSLDTMGPSGLVSEQLFPAGALFPALVEMCIYLSSLTGGDVGRIVSSCPALQTLRLLGNPTSAACAALQALPRLRSLRVEEVSDVATARELAKLTRLTSLECNVGAEDDTFAVSASPTVCQQLGALVDLHEVALNVGREVEGTWFDYHRICFSNKVGLHESQCCGGHPKLSVA